MSIHTTYLYIILNNYLLFKMSMFFWYYLVCADVFCKNVTADPRPAEMMDQHELLIQSKYSNHTSLIGIICQKKNEGQLCPC